MNISEVVENYEKIKKDINSLEKKKESYKKHIMKVMEKNNLNTLNAGNFIVTFKNNTRETMSRDSVPYELWKKYCNKCNYKSIYVKSKK